MTTTEDIKRVFEDAQLDADLYLLRERVWERAAQVVWRRRVRDYGFWIAGVVCVVAAIVEVWRW